MATAHMTKQPHAHSVTPGYWICEKDEKFEEFIDEGSKQEQADAAVDHSDEELEVAYTNAEVETAVDHSDEELEVTYNNAEVETAVDLPAPEYDVEAGTQEGMNMADSGSQGYLTWSKSGLQVDVRMNGSEETRPDVGSLKKALRSFQPPPAVVVTVTEILGSGSAWVSLQVQPGSQGQLLISTGLVIEHLTNAGLCNEVLLTGNPGQQVAAN